VLKLKNQHNHTYFKGLRVTLTPDLRPKEAGLLWFGVAVNIRQVIPPKQTDFVTQGHCDPACTEVVSYLIAVLNDNGMMKDCILSRYNDTMQSKKKQSSQKFKSL